MMSASVTYGDLRRQLLDLGFEDQSGEHLVYQHPKVKAALLRMALHELGEPMLERDLVAARAVLELNGLMERDEFDQWVRDRKAQKVAAS
jgi:hypothetical protein